MKKLIIAMGMMSENMQRQALGQSMAYTEEDFLKLLDEPSTLTPDYCESFNQMMGLENGIDGVFIKKI